MTFDYTITSGALIKAERLLHLMTVAGNSPEELAAFIRREQDELAKATGARLE
jgi:hypothetical protein